MTRAIILTTQRSGSTLLVSSLQSHPEILCHGELLIAGLRMPPPKRLKNHRHLFKLTRFVTTGAWLSTRTMRRFYAIQGPRAHVFKAMYNHLRPPWTLNYLLHDPGIRVIHLQRRNLLKQYISLLLMGRKRENQWLPNTKEPVPPLRLRVDPQRAIRYFERMERSYPHFARLFARHTVLPLVYEDMVEEQQIRADVADQLCDFLAVSRRPLTSSYIKINPESLRDVVTNYDELTAALRPTKFTAFLD